MILYKREAANKLLDSLSFCFYNSLPKLGVCIRLFANQILNKRIASENLQCHTCQAETEIL